MELLVLIPLTGFILFWQRWQQTSIASATLHIVSAIILILYTAGMIGVLPEVRGLLLVSGLMAVVFELAKNRRSSLSVLASVPMVALLIMCVAFYLVHGNSEFHFYDEFAHWGIYLKDMIAIGGFWGADTNSMHPRYPPGPTLWQYLFVIDAERIESAAYFGQFVLLLSPLLILFDSLKWKQAGWAGGVLVLFLFGFGNFGHGIASIYNDHLLSAWLAGVFLNFMAEPRNRSYSRLALYILPLSTVALFKNAGLIFALILPLLFVTLVAIRRGRLILANKKLFFTLLPLLAAWIAGPLIVTTAWNQNRDELGARQSGMEAPSILGILSGKIALEDPRRTQVVNKMFADVFLRQQLSKTEVSGKFSEFNYSLMPEYKSRFKLTTASFLVLFVIWSAFLLWLIVPRQLRWEWALGLAGMLGIAILYIAVLYLTYLFYRDNMVSYVRYVHSVILALVFTAFAPLLPAFSQRIVNPATDNGRVPDSARPIIFAFVLLALIVIERPYFQALLPNTGQNLSMFRDYIKGTAGVLRQRVGRHKLWLYFPDNDEHNFMSRIMLFELAPTPTTINRDFDYFNRPGNEILAEWADYDFIWIAYQDEDVDRQLRALVGEKLGERFFQVKKVQGRLVVEHAEIETRDPE